MPAHVPNTAFAVAQDIRDLAGYLEYRAGCCLRGAVRGIDWHFTTADARIKLKHLYPKMPS